MVGIGVVLAVLAACSMPSNGTGASGAGQTQERLIAPAPAFPPDDLTAPPTQDWITYGGNVYNQRFADLSQIDTSNVAGLEGVWRIHLDSALGEKYSAEGTPIVYRGVIYLSTGANDVFAISVASGDVLWS